jgi:hypothetical protein
MASFGEILHAPAPKGLACVNLVLITPLDLGLLFTSTLQIRKLKQRASKSPNRQVTPSPLRAGGLTSLEAQGQPQSEAKPRVRANRGILPCQQ